MKVIFFNSCKKWGGGEKWHYEMSTALSHENFQIVFFAQKQTKLYHYVERSEIDVRAVKISSLSFLNPFLIFRLYRYFKEINPSAIILNLPIDIKTAGVAAKLAGVPGIIYRRGSAISIRNSISNRFLFKHIITNILANSKVTANTILAKNKNLFPESKIKVIHNGINLADFEETADEKTVKQKNTVVLGNLARLSYQKGQKYLINLADRLRSKGVDFKMVIGGEGELESELKQMVDELKLADYVVFSGFVQDVKAFLSDIDIFVFPSIWEGFGFSIVEAKMMKKPIVCFNVSSNAEIVKQNHDGFLVESFNEDEFFNKVTLLINDIELRHKMGVLGRLDVIKRFDKERAVRELSAYLKIIY